jgi:hypothetical protein
MRVPPGCPQGFDSHLRHFRRGDTRAKPCRLGRFPTGRAVCAWRTRAGVFCGMPPIRHHADPVKTGELLTSGFPHQSTSLLLRRRTRGTRDQMEGPRSAALLEPPSATAAASSTPSPTPTHRSPLAAILRPPRRTSDGPAWANLQLASTSAAEILDSLRASRVGDPLHANRLSSIREPLAVAVNDIQLGGLRRVGLRPLERVDVPP